MLVWLLYCFKKESIFWFTYNAFIPPDSSAIIDYDLNSFINANFYLFPTFLDRFLDLHLQ